MANEILQCKCGHSSADEEAIVAYKGGAVVSCRKCHKLMDLFGGIYGEDKTESNSDDDFSTRIGLLEIE